MNNRTGRIEGACPYQVLALIALPLFLAYVLMVPRTFAADAKQEAVALQPIIDRAHSGDKIELAPGMYTGPVVIDKSVSITGEHATLLNQSSAADAVMLIRADGVRVQGLNIHQNANGESAAVLVQAARVSLSDLEIQTAGYGIVLRNASDGMIENNEIRGPVRNASELETVGNGIDLYQSHGATIIGNRISELQDGIYLEDNRNTTVERNQLSYLRYGIHCMYIDGSTVKDNVGEYNVTGAMIMGVTHAAVSGNSFRKQDQNVHAQGILLYDVHKSSIERNTVEGNRVGFYIEDSSDNTLSGNMVVRNFIGIQFINASGNEIQQNGFISNVIEAEAARSRDNELKHNYWDSFQALDVTGDGLSDIPYTINPFYQQLIDRNSSYQLFFQSPSMTFLSDRFAGGREQWTTDQTPLMNFKTAAQAENHESYGTVMVVACLLLFLSVISIVYMGVLRS